MLLTGKTALITAASSSCRAMIANHFAAQGVTVIVNYLKK